jgi:hypothetical protein
MACKHKRSWRAFRGRTLEAPDDGTAGCHSFVSFLVVKWGSASPAGTKMARKCFGQVMPFTRWDIASAPAGSNEDVSPQCVSTGRASYFPYIVHWEGKPLPFQKRFRSLGSRP